MPKFNLLAVWPRWLLLGLGGVASLLTVVSVHSGFSPEILHGESGYYQVMAHSSPETQANLIGAFFTTSSHGHYTPLAFTAEFYFTRLAGFQLWIWQSRQVLLGSMIMFCLFVVVLETLPRRNGLAFVTAFGLSFVSINQRAMIDLLRWPFHIFQILWILATLILLLCWMRLPSGPPKLIWLNAFLSYLTMHLLGLGLATAAATLAILGWLFVAPTLHSCPDPKSRRQTLLLAMAVLGAVVLTHGWLMTAWNDAGNSHGISRYPWQRSLGYLVLAPVSIGLGLFARLPDPSNIARTLAGMWPGGATVIIILLFYFGLLWRSYRRIRSDRVARTIILSLGSTLMLLAITAMLGLREAEEPTSSSWYGYLIGPRYILPISVCWLGLLAGAINLLPDRAHRYLVFLTILLAGFTVIPQKAQRWDIKAVHPYTDLQTWEALVELAREDMRLHRPIPNVPLANMTGFDFMDLKFCEPLLRHSLNLDPNRSLTFREWGEVWTS